MALNKTVYRISIFSKAEGDHWPINEWSLSFPTDITFYRDVRAVTCEKPQTWEFVSKNNCLSGVLAVLHQRPMLASGECEKRL